MFRSKLIISIALLGVIGSSITLRAEDTPPKAPAAKPTPAPVPIPNKDKPDSDTVHVVVTAPKTKPVDESKQSITNEPMSKVKERLARVAGGTNVVDTDDVKKGRSSNVQDLFAWTPGVIAQTRNGDESRLSIRGSGVQRTFHGRGIEVMQDGIPLNLADGSFDFQAIDPLAFRYTEVFRGANALQYGSGTLGGAINMVSPTGYDAPKAQARIETGSYGLLRTQVSSGMVVGPADYYISLSQYSEDGYRAHENLDDKRIFGNFGYKINQNLENRFYVSYTRSNMELPGSLTRAEMRKDPQMADPSAPGTPIGGSPASIVPGDNRRDYELARVADKVVYRWDQQSLEGSLSFSYKDLDHPIFQVIDQINNDLGANVKYTNNHKVFGHQNTWIAGVTSGYGTVEDKRFENIFGGRGRRTGYNHQVSINTNWFGEEQFHVLDNFTIVGGAQFNYSTRDNEVRFPVGTNPTVSVPDNNERREYTALNPKFGFIWDFTKRSQVYGNVSRSFEPPSLGEFSRFNGTPAKTQGQKAWTYEVGTRGHEGRFAWDFAAYHAQVRQELISFLEDPNNAFSATTFNADKTTHTGVEVSFDVELFKGIAAKDCKKDQDRIVLRQVYNWGRYRFDGDPIYGDNQIAGLPEHTWRSELVYEHPVGFYAGPNVYYQSQYNIDHMNTFQNYGYTLFGFKAGYQTRRGFSAYVEGRNLTDKTYSATTGIVSDAKNVDQRVHMPGDGRGVYVGLEWKW